VELIVLPTASEVARVAADKVAGVFMQKTEGVIGLATGSSPLAIYRELARRVSGGALDFSRVRGFALDEYVGIADNHPESYAAVIRREVVEPLGMDPALVHVPDGSAEDLEEACDRYEAAIAASGGVDLQILGIGRNGHIGFNEPGSSFGSRTRDKALAPQTRLDNARFFDSPADVPARCLTQGIGTILESRELVLVAQGEAKAQAIASAVEGPLTSMCPASALQLHRRATLIVDEAAAQQLTRTDYYRHAYEVSRSTGA
jgi:glucosamine-6-phosphate deaminase